MASSPPPPSLTVKRLESLSSKKSSRTSDHPDDASSFTSMSSNSNATICRICKEAESLTSPFITCIRCRSRYHTGCTNPRIIDRRVDYTCARCVEKARKSHKSAPPRARQGEPVKGSRSVEGQQASVNPRDCGSGTILCEANCGKIAKPPIAPNTKHLCFMCGMIEKSNTFRKLPPPKTPPVARPIQKKKLYHLRPDDRPLVTNKRKRSSSGQTLRTRTAASLGLAASKESSIHSKHPMTGRPVRVATHDDSKKRQADSPDTPKVLQHPPKAPELSGGNYKTNANITQHDPFLLLSARRKSPHRMDWNFLPRMYHLEDRSGPFEVNSAGDRSTSPTSTTEAQLPPLVPIIAYPAKPSQGSPRSRAGVDDKMLDSSESNRLAQHESSFLQPPSPRSDLSSHESSPDVPPVEDDIEPAVAIEAEASLELFDESRQCRMANGFDETELDFFIQKQAQRDPFYEPSLTELLETQNWGAVDPRTIWPQRMSDAQREQKMIEIAARGGRKKNFGKTLHAQLVQERTEMGWDLHQSREKRDDEEFEEAVNRLEELFGVPEGILDNCVPGTIDGRLVMQERERYPEPRRPGRQKKEAPPSVFPVIGGQ